MDFQSAARFGERRVMVTDYDETAVEVNAKVVDEDTGEVICESGGGGESDFSTAEVLIANNSDANVEIFVPNVNAEDNTARHSVTLDASESGTITVIMYKGNSSYYIEPDPEKGVAAEITGNIEPSPMVNTIGMIKGNGTITLTNNN